MLKSVTFGALVLAASLSGASACTNGPPLQSTAVPALPGRVAFQGVDPTLGTQLYLFDFVSKAQTEISRSWGLKSPLNPQFTPDGKFIVFSAVNSAGTVRDVYVWPVGAAAPQNLTRGGASGAAKSEDPKWRGDQQAIVFKQDGNIKVMTVAISGQTVSSTGLTALTTNGVNGTATEASQPYYTPDGKYVYFTRNSGAAQTLHVLTVALGQASELPFNTNNNYAYYPAVRDFSTVVYTGWTTGTTLHADQILLQAPLLTGASVISLLVNDCTSDNSDPAPVDTDYLIYSNDRTAGYRPYLGSYSAAQAWDLSRIGLGAGVNSPILGMNYTAAR